MTAWTIQLLIVGVRTLESERRALARGCERGLLHRVRQGVYVDLAAWSLLPPEGRHIVAMRALHATSNEPPVFSHWSAAVLQGLPFLGRHLERVHVTVPIAGRRGLAEVAGHIAPVTAADLVTIGGLAVTTLARTVLDIAMSGSFEDGVVVADAALQKGLRRDLLHAAIDRAGGRRGVRKAQAAVSFGRPEAEAPSESCSRVTMFRLGIAPPVLQHEVFDRRGLAGRLDFWFPVARVGGEVDGVRKYLDLALAPDGAGQAVVAEKWREDRIRAAIARLARWGWNECRSVVLLGPILADAGVHPSRTPITLADYSTPFLTEQFVTTAQLRDMR